MQPYLQFVIAHPALFAAVVLLLVLIAANELHGNLTGGKRLSAHEAVRLINDRNPLLIDLRSANDFKRSHLLGAVNIPAAKLLERLADLGKDKARPVLLYDALGGGAAEAAIKLRKQGFTEAYPLRGGINAWQGASLPVTAK